LEVIMNIGKEEPYVFEPIEESPPVVEVAHD
jgi:hypothetical protein